FPPRLGDLSIGLMALTSRERRHDPVDLIADVLPPRLGDRLGIVEAPRGDAIGPEPVSGPSPDPVDPDVSLRQGEGGDTRGAGDRRDQQGWWWRRLGAAVRELGAPGIDARADGLLESRHRLVPVATHHDAKGPAGRAGPGPGPGVILPFLGVAGALDRLLGLPQQVLRVGRLALDSGLAALLQILGAADLVPVGLEPQ